jgi:polysaccharide pyruvyl transferase WcaK-like protein
MTEIENDTFGKEGHQQQERKRTSKKIAVFGHFDSTNFGNETTLAAFLYHLRCFQPGAEITCISTGPEATIATHHIEAIPLSETFFRSWVPRNPVTRRLRKIFVDLPSVPYQWAMGLMWLRCTDALIIPGTGLLTDAYGLTGWGPLNLFKWSLIAKACGCKLLFVSIGAGPVYGTLGRWLVKSILKLADYRSYRDPSTMRYLNEIGFRADNDRVYPDLAFSLPKAMIPHADIKNSGRSVVGLGIMMYAGKYSVANPNDTIYLAYLDGLVTIVKWLLARDYDVRLLIGDLVDVRASREFRDVLRQRLSACDEARIIDEPIGSVEDLLSQIAATEIVVATRFHNVLLALLCSKPVIAISFHHKCESLMSAMGLSDYCLDINDLNADRLIEKICDVETNANQIKSLIGEKQKRFREELDEQYKMIFADI